MSGPIQDLKIPFRSEDCCGPCGIVADSFPGKLWDECVEDYRNRKPNFVGSWNKFRSIAEAGISAYLPKAVRSAVHLSVQFAQVFFFLPLMLFNVFFPDVVVEEIKRFKVVALLDFENKTQQGLLLKPTPRGRKMNLPEVRISRDSVLYIEEDLCPAMQIREKQSSEVFAYQSKTRIKNRSQVLKDIGCQKALSFDEVSRIADKWTRLQAAKPKEPIEIDADEPGAANRTLVDADVEGEAPAPKKKKPSAHKRAKNANAKSIMKKFRHSLDPSVVVKVQKTAEGAGARKSDAAILDLEGDDDDDMDVAKGSGGEDASGEEVLSGSEGEFQKSAKVDHQAILLQVVPMGNKEQGVPNLVAFPYRQNPVQIAVLEPEHGLNTAKIRISSITI